MPSHELIPEGAKIANKRPSGVSSQTRLTHGWPSSVFPHNNIHVLIL